VRGGSAASDRKGKNYAHLFYNRACRCRSVAMQRTDRVCSNAGACAGYNQSKIRKRCRKRNEHHIHKRNVHERNIHEHNIYHRKRASKT
jgi:hypothetical protein